MSYIEKGQIVTILYAGFELWVLFYQDRNLQWEK